MVPALKLNPIGSSRQREKAFGELINYIRSTVDERPGKLRQHSQHRSRRPETPTPKFIASLCDRREQKEQLKKALVVQKTQMAEKGYLVPLVCFIHGELQESLESLKLRLADHDIYELLELDRNKYSVRKLDLTWPYMDWELSNPQTHFQNDLVLKGRPRDSNQEVLEILGKHPGPVMLCYDFIVDNWNADSPAIIEEFLSFWGSVAQINSATPFIVCLFFEYGQADTTSPNVHAQRNAEARDYFLTLQRKLSDAAYRYLPNLCGVVLKELGPVSKTEVYEWILDSRAFAEFCIKHRPRFCPDETQEMKIAITDLYSSGSDRDENRKIPMNQLVDSRKDY